MGEQERENLRIDAQRLKEELSELKIEVEVLQDRLRKQESRHLSMISTDISVPESPTFDKSIGSPESTASSPLISTPPDTIDLPPSKPTVVQDPPSPPMSDASGTLRRPRLSLTKTPAPSTQRKSRLPSADNSVTPKPRPTNFSSSLTKRPVTRVATATPATKTPANRTTAPRSTSHRLPTTNNSLSHIRSLTAQVQRLEARVQSARSRLPARVNTPPRPSPRSSINGMGSVPSTVTIRSRRRATGSVTSASASVASDDTTPTNPSQGARKSTQTAGKHIPRLSTSGVSRLSFGPLPNRNPGGDSEASMSRPSSRASITSGYARPSSRTDMNPPPRPLSRTSLSGARTPLSRPRSSLGGSLHGHSASVGRFDPDEFEDDSDLRTPSRRGTFSKLEMEGVVSRIPAPASSIPAPTGRRQSGGPRRVSSGFGFRESEPLDELDETY